MKVLLTGYSGFLGGHLARHLAESGYSVRVVGHRAAIRRRDFNEHFDIIWGALERPGVVEQAVDGVEAVVHSAWIWPGAAGRNKAINKDIASLLWAKSVDAGASAFAFISSVACYGMKVRGNKSVTESTPLAQGPELEADYPRQKVDVEDWLRTRAGKPDSPRLAIFRPGVIIDDRKAPGKLLRLGSTELAIGFGSGRNHMPYVHADDVARAVVLWLKQGDGDGVYNVTPSRCLRNRDWFKAWSARHSPSTVNVFIPAVVLRAAALGANVLKRALRKPPTSVKYVLKTATRDLQYCNQALAHDLNWQDSETEKYWNSIP